MNPLPVASELHRIFSSLRLTEPPFSIADVLAHLFPEVQIGARRMKNCASMLEVYDGPLADGTRAFISYDPMLSRGARRFFVAHELAHWIFDYSRRPEWDPADGAWRPLSERRADFFASGFLVPSWCLHPMVDFYLDDPSFERRVARLARRFVVANYHMKARVFDLYLFRRFSIHV